MVGVDGKEEVLTEQVGLRDRLGHMYSQWRKVLFWRGAARLSAGFILTLALLCGLDEFLLMPYTARLLMAVAMYGAFLTFAWQKWLRYCLRPYSPRAMAWVLESIFPDFHERLISGVEFTEQQIPQHGISTELIGRAVVEAGSDLRPLKPQEVFPMRRGLLRLPLLLLVTMAALSLVPALHVPLRVGRVAFPSPSDPSIGPVRLILLPGPSIRDEGDTVLVQVRSQGRLTRDVELVVSNHTLQRFVMEPDEEEGSYSVRLADVRDSFRVWARSGAVRSRTHSIRVRSRPTAERFLLTYRFPPYCGLSPNSAEASTGDIAGLEGTRVSVVLRASEPLADCRVAHNGMQVPVTLSESRLEAAFEIELRQSGSYTVKLANPAGLRNRASLVYPVSVEPDLRPIVRLVNPTKDVNLDFGESLQVEWQAYDDFGIASQRMTLGLPGSNPILSAELPADVRRWEMVLEGGTVPPAVDLELSVTVVDEAGQSTTALPVGIAVGAGGALEGIAEYIEACRALEEVFLRLLENLEAFDTYSRYLESGGREQDAEPHYRIMRDSKIDSIKKGFQSVQNLIIDLRAGGRFPKSGHYAEVVRRYLEQELLFSVAELSRPQPRPAVERITKMIRLSSEMQQALLEKAQQQERTLELSLRQQTLSGLQDSERREGAGEKLSLFLASLADTVPELEAQLPPIPTIYVDADTYSQAVERTAEILAELERKTERMLTNTRRLDKAAAAIEKELRRAEDQLRGLVERLEQDGKEEDWTEALDLAESYAQIASVESNPSRRADAVLIAAAMETAVQKRNSHLLGRIAETIAALDIGQPVEDLLNRLRFARFKGEQLNHLLVRKAALDRRAALDILAALHTELSDLRTNAKVLAEIVDPKSLETVGRNIERADQSISRIAGLIRRDRVPGRPRREAGNEIDRMNDAMDKAFEQLTEPASEQLTATEAMRHGLALELPDTSDQIETIASRLQAESFRLWEPEASLSGAADILTETMSELNARVRFMRDKARRDLGLSRLPPSSVLEALTIASALSNVSHTDVSEALEAIRESAGGETGRNNTDSTAYALATASDKMMRAAERFRVLAEMTRLHEVSVSGKLPPSELQSTHERIIETTAHSLDTETNDALQGARAFATALGAAIAMCPGDEASGQTASDEPCYRLARAIAATSWPALIEARRNSVRSARGTIATSIERIQGAGSAKVRAGGENRTGQRLRKDTQTIQRDLTRVDAANALSGSVFPVLVPGFLNDVAPTLRAAAEALPIGSGEADVLSDGEVLLQQLDRELRRMLEEIRVEAVLHRFPEVNSAPARQGGKLSSDVAEIEKALRKAAAAEQARAAMMENDLRGRDSQLVESIENNRERALEAILSLARQLRADKPPGTFLLQLPLLNLRINAVAGDFSNALLNLAAIRRGLRERNGPAGWQVDSTPMGRVSAPPELVPGALSGLDLNALKGVALELANEGKDGAFLGSAEAVSSALRGNYLEAALATRDDAAAEFAKAARTRDVVARDIGTIPARFRMPHDPIEAQLLSRFRKTAKHNPQTLAEEALTGLGELSRVLDDEGGRLESTNMRDSLARVEAMRAILGWRSFPASVALRKAERAEDSKGAGEAIAELKHALSVYAEDLQELDEVLREGSHLGGEVETLRRLAIAGHELMVRLRAEPAAGDLSEIVNEALRDPYLPPVDRRMLADLIENLRILTPLEQATAVELAADALSEDSARLALRMDRAASALREDEALREREAQLGVRRAAVAQGAAELDSELAQMTNIAANRARRKIKDALEQLAGNNWQGCAWKLAEAQAPLADLQRLPKVDATLNDAAYDAAAIALGLRNREATAHAGAGDLRNAAASMEKLAEEIDDEQAKALALEAAAAFRQAEREALRQLPSQLREGLVSTQAAVADVDLPRLGSEALRGATAAILNRDYAVASRRLSQALRYPAMRKLPEIWELVDIIEEEEGRDARTVAALQSQARQAILALHSLPEEPGLLVRAQVGKAIDSTMATDFTQAVDHIKVSLATAPPAAAATALEESIQLLERADLDVYGTLREPAKRLLRSIREAFPAVAADLRSEQYAQAARTAAEAGETNLAARVLQTAEARARELPEAARQTAATLGQLSLQDQDGVNTRVLALAHDRILTGDFAAADETIRTGLGALLQVAEVALAIEAAAMEQKTLAGTFERAASACREDRFPDALEELSDVPDVPGVESELGALTEAERLSRDLASKLYQWSFSQTSGTEARVFVDIADLLLAGKTEAALDLSRKVNDLPPEAAQELARLTEVVQGVSERLSELQRGFVTELEIYATDLAIRVRDVRRRIAALSDAVPVLPADTVAAIAEAMDGAVEHLGAGDLGSAAALMDTVPEVARKVNRAAAALRALSARDSAAEPAMNGPGLPYSMAALRAMMAAVDLEIMAANDLTRKAAQDRLDSATRALQTAVMLSETQALLAMTSNETPASTPRTAPVGTQENYPDRELLPWTDNPEDFWSGQSRGTSDVYDTYYRKANRAYLERIATESRRWE